LVLSTAFNPAETGNTQNIAMDTIGKLSLSGEFTPLPFGGRRKQ